MKKKLLLMTLTLKFIQVKRLLLLVLQVQVKQQLLNC